MIDRERLATVTQLIMGILGGFATREMLGQLEDSSHEHEDCAWGAVPACTCGWREAGNFLKLFNGEISGERLLAVNQFGIRSSYATSQSRPHPNAAYQPKYPNRVADPGD